MENQSAEIKEKKHYQRKINKKKSFYEKIAFTFYMFFSI